MNRFSIPPTSARYLLPNPLHNLKRPVPEMDPSVPKPRKRYYPAHMKIELCEEAEIKGTRGTARKYGIPKTNLLTWVRIYREKGESGFKNPLYARDDEHEEEEDADTNTNTNMSYNDDSSAYSLGRVPDSASAGDNPEGNTNTPDPKRKYMIISDLLKLGNGVGEASGGSGISVQTLKGWKGEYLFNRDKYKKYWEVETKRLAALMEAIEFGEEVTCWKYGITVEDLGNFREISAGLGEKVIVDKMGETGETEGDYDINNINNVNVKIISKEEREKKLLGDNKYGDSLEIPKDKKGGEQNESKFHKLSQAQLDGLRAIADLSSYILEMHDQYKTVKLTNSQYLADTY